MRYVDEFRDPAAAERLVANIRRRATRRWTLMEVCGGQTHSLLRHGIDAALSDAVEMIHGPGCPVCVTPLESIDRAQSLAQRPDVLLTTFGDMLRVPGSHGSLLDIRTGGGNVRAVYSPLDAVRLATERPERHVVFFAVGFETTAPATALAVLQAARLSLDNFSLLVSHVRVQPAMEHVMRVVDNRVQGFLAAGHVCTVMGYESYGDFVQRFSVPVVVTGFEPLDLLQGIARCVNCLETRRPQVCNEYRRNVSPAGNPAAQDVVRAVYEICDRPWRGMGLIPKGGLRLRDRWRRFDAEQRFEDVFPTGAVADHRGGAAGNALARQATREYVEIPAQAGVCLAGDVLSGRMKPTACPAFGTQCTPEHPCGAPMVSSEGACAAYFLYHPSSSMAGRSADACAAIESPP